MIDQNLTRGIFLILFAMIFGVTAALNYPVGSFAHGGPGLFPVLISILLGLVGLATVIRAWFEEGVPVNLQIKNIAVIIASLCCFAIISEHVNMVVGIVLMVFVAAIAGTHYSWWRNVKVSVVLVLIAFGFQRGLGLNLPLY
ncbi:MAG: tripartite tricarboxylate transporter TctB family protein [Xenophilus sp.]